VTIAFDATSGSAALINTATTTNWTHTPAGTPRAVVGLVPQGTSTDTVTSMSYGGVAMARIRRQARAGAEAGDVYTYFLGSGIPTGAQTVSIVTTGTAPKWPQVVTFTAATDCEVNVETGADAGTIANPSIAITPTDQAGVCYVCMCGLNTPVDTPEAGTTRASFRDLGTVSGHQGYKVVSAGATTIGWTSAIEEICHAAIAVVETRLILPRPVSVGPSQAVHQSHSW